ncbi:hypothetical protein K443DRAFT_120775 [Laccaria amethystina LaAM-08-1]|uniref:Uncharacterized protein n=1 Tax=Laccaria amethystina LaAM-08-1 TaxID=1095629 RepID=A0A0C9Y9N9_9AGAR|nr:hypothetical protein K443DRAFT_120775 [Laccaria amethystina LaAM-08-1]
MSEEGLVDLDTFSKPKTSLLATATEDELLRAGNVAYTWLLDAYNHTKQQYNKIDKHYRKLKASDRPPISVSSAPIIPAPLPLLPVTMAADTNATVDARQQNFPKMCFWFKRDYMKFTQTKKSNDGITGLNQGTKLWGRVQLQENENKTTIKRMQETMPESWGQASVTFKRFLIREVYKQFPCMRWCDNDWKVHFLATRVYSNWLKAQQKKEARTKVKIEKWDDSGASMVNLTRDSTPPEQLKVTTAVSPISKRKASPALDADTVASAQGSLIWFSGLFTGDQH